MKIIFKNFKILLVLLFLFFEIFANNPPVPSNTGKTTAGLPPPPPGKANALPIDDYENILMIIALFLGFYIFYCPFLKKKTPN